MECVYPWAFVWWILLHSHWTRPRLQSHGHESGASHLTLGKKANKQISKNVLSFEGFSPFKASLCLQGRVLQDEGAVEVGQWRAGDEELPPQRIQKLDRSAQKSFLKKDRRTFHPFSELSVRAAIHVEAELCLLCYDRERCQQDGQTQYILLWERQSGPDSASWCADDILHVQLWSWWGFLNCWQTEMQCLLSAWLH